MPSFVQKLSAQPHGTHGKKLVIIQLSGGNDGLNTIVPFEDDRYYQARPSLGIDKKEVLKLTDLQGMNPAMKALREVYDQGYMSILNSVGYPNPDRSHFRSMDIWQTGSSANDHWDTGWLGRYLDHACKGNDPHKIMEIDGTLSLAMKGENMKGIAIQDPKKLRQAMKDPWFTHLLEGQKGAVQSDLDYLYKTMTETYSSVDYIYEKSRVFQSKMAYPQSPLAKKLKMVAELICSGIETSVFYVSFTGFDTHVRQAHTHTRLLTQYSEAVSTFLQDLESHDQLDHTLVMTFSEFGRRVDQNASGGTDHGKANNLFLMGGKLQTAGIFNEAPDLAKLDEGDVSYRIDFRQVYATLLDRWLETSSQKILHAEMPQLNLI
ncbi:MAG: DUF1501 domain-containing protein [Bacteroidota bacterium]